MPPRTSTTKETIREAAASLFTERGYARTTVRDIAARAGADPSLVIRHFGSKVDLFVETMRAASGDVLTVDTPLATMGVDLVRFVLNADEPARSTYLALVRASDTDDVATLLRRIHEDTIVAPLRDRLEGTDAGLRAALVAAMIAGLMQALWITQDQELLAASADQILARYAPLIQALIEPGETHFGRE
jgi:AcrR family transcriptional regulator